jgi:hypothetical protein
MAVFFVDFYGFHCYSAAPTYDGLCEKRHKIPLSYDFARCFSLVKQGDDGIEVPQAPCARPGGVTWRKRPERLNYRTALYSGIGLLLTMMPFCSLMCFYVPFYRVCILPVSV